MANPMQGSAMESIFRSEFPENAMYRFDPEMLMEIALTEGERCFLAEVGLPKDEILGWTFDPAIYGLRRVSRIASDRKFFGFDDSHQIVLAGGQDAVACINLEPTRCVLSIDLEKRDQQRFINSNLICFVSCLAAFLSCGREAAGRREDEVESIVNAFVERIRSFDPACLDNAENWWSLIVEEFL